MTDRDPTQRLTHAATGCGNVIAAIDRVIYIGDINEVDCPVCLRLIEEYKDKQRIAVLADAVKATEQALGALKWAQQADDIITVNPAVARVNWMQVARDALTDALTTLEEKP